MKREVSVSQGDCLAVLAVRDGPLFDACVTDPPYHLTSIVKRFGGKNAIPAKVGQTGAFARASAGFMGQQWDGGDVAFRPETWRAIYDQMKPGAYLVAFSGTRTYHRMAVAIDDAGFEVRDQLAWVYGSGFPKSHDVSKAIDRALGAEREVIGTPEAAQWEGWGTALKPAWEPICLARKPLAGTVAASVLAHGTGALNIDACRIPSSDTIAPVSGEGTLCGVKEGYDRPWKHDPKALAARQDRANAAVDKANKIGRYPANLLHDGSDEVLEAFPETPGQQRSVGPANGPKDSVNVFGDYGPRTQSNPRGDEGSAARFFYSAKAGPLDRMSSEHPTVKPVDLMRWVCRLVTPPGGLILDPFAGSGTTGIAAMAEGFNAELIDLEPKHVADIERKLALLRGEGRHVMAEHLERKAARAKRHQMPLFGDAA